MHTLAEWLDASILRLANQFDNNSFFFFTWNINALIAIVLVSLICGAMGTVVVGNRMAFFSDALAHCAWAGVAFGIVLAIVAQVSSDFIREWLTFIMIGFGILIGVCITLVQERTGLPNDTVIGVFFAGALGLGAASTSLVSHYRIPFDIEKFIFGNPLGVKTVEILWLLVLLALTWGVFWFLYNDIVLTSVNPSLAKSRRVPVRLCRYAFVVLLGIVVNLCLQVVGTLLINGMLLVPAATAANLARNLRELFWWSVGLSAVTGILGQFLNWELSCQGVNLGLSGTIVVLGVLLAVVLPRVKSLVLGRDSLTMTR